MTRTPVMAGNWKMNNGIGQAVMLAQELSNAYEKSWREAVDIVVFPPFPDLKAVWTVFDFDRVPFEVGAQNVHWEQSGAFTGEVSVPMIREVGCCWCIVGHSERRLLFGETNEDVNRKVHALVAAKMKPIVCVGESLAVREAGTTCDFVCAQVRAAFAGIDETQAPLCTVAYEPLWAIGTGKTASPEQADEVCAAIRSEIAELFEITTANTMRVLYGGSMNPGNVSALLAQPNIDGGLVGGASLDAASFVSMIQACVQ